MVALLGYEALHFLRSLCVCELTKINDRQSKRQVTSNVLNGSAFHSNKRCAKNIMSPDDFAEGLFQRAQINIALKTNDTPNIVCGANRFELRRKPQALLREGERAGAVF
jgi:hypothetical protein